MSSSADRRGLAALPRSVRAAARVFWHAALRWVADGAMTSAAAIAFYTISSLGPSLLIALAGAGWIFGEKPADAAIYGQLATLLGPDGARAVHALIQSASQPREGWIAKTIAPVVIFISATGIFGEIQSALNTIWRYKAQASVLTVVGVRLKSFAIIVGAGFILVVSLLVNATIAGLGDAIFGDRETAWLIWGLHTGLATVMTTLIFAAIFKILPDAYIDWVDAFVGAAAAAVLFTFGKFGIGFYLAKTNVASSYGAAGTFILVLMWVYYSSLIFLYGAEVAWLWRAHRRGEVRPSSD